MRRRHETLIHELIILMHKVKEDCESPAESKLEFLTRVNHIILIGLEKPFSTDKAFSCCCYFKVTT